MTDGNKDGDYPAFPITAGNQVYAQGMSLRDYAAIQFMSALISTEAGLSSISKVAKEGGIRGGLCAAGAAYEFADDLMMIRSAKK